jgi:phosphorylase/glycogen(starch) synthase
MIVDYLFETSWEVCNMVGGINTVLSSKANIIVDKLGDNYITIGPDVWKEPVEHPYFTEEITLFADWKEHAQKNGLNIKIGRWKIPGTPIAILVDFTPLFAEKDAVFAGLWENYKLDSLAGQWDYIEPAMFGIAAGKVIEDFYKYYINPGDKVVAHFHEWMTGTGVLYLEDLLPAIGTIFTTHATVLGRTVAGNGHPLYESLSEINPDESARNFNVISKNSLETLSARHADVLTTVSGITAKECAQFFGKNPDIITPNGFSEKYVPQGDKFEEHRETARSKALTIASQMTGKEYPEDSFLVITSGRYEYRNKGIDILIEALARINDDPTIDKPVIAFITIPSAHIGPIDRSLDANTDIHGKYLTHYLREPHYDPILNKIREKNLTNNKNSKVDIIFAPVYLDGRDGVIDLSYYDFLIGFDISVFPSYYEPWGYTPMESIAFGIPTLTTSVAGFGDWVKNNFSINHKSVEVAVRKEGSFNNTVGEVSAFIKSHFLSENREASRKEAFEIFGELKWEKLMTHYQKAWELAVAKGEGRKTLHQAWKRPEGLRIEDSVHHDKPNWRTVLVNTTLPGSLQRLKEIAHNLWWCWNYDAIDLFRNIDPDLWFEKQSNPIAVLQSLSRKKVDKLKSNKQFLKKLDKVYTHFQSYLEERKAKDYQVAYFCMEYGLHVSLQIYSGGLGVLAGDYLKQASDSGKNMVAVGLLYRFGYFKQVINAAGEQVNVREPQKFTQLPLIPVRNGNGDWVTIRVALPGRVLVAKAWQVMVGSVPLYLLDTDISENSEEDKLITAQLYGGDRDMRIKQELLLGIGGVRLLKQLEIQPDVFHINEGHASFSLLERIRELIVNKGYSFSKASEIVRTNSLFTTHTPVPAGHDYFEEHTMRAYLSHFADQFRMEWNDFLALGRFQPGNLSEKYSMSVLASKLSSEINGVSKLHGEVTRDMLVPLYPGFFAHELHINHVTNGVHYPTWTTEFTSELHKKTFGDEFFNNQYDEDIWKKIYDLSDEKIWKLKQNNKHKLIEYLKQKLKRDLMNRQVNPGTIIRTLEGLDENALFIGFARRFATYKRAHLLFSNLDRLDKIVNKSGKPVVFLFAGKAHPRDKMGQDLIKRIVQISNDPRFTGKIIFIENYNLILGKMLTSGVDVWLNTPTRPLEASGTSGEKAVLNGVMNLSVLDGWYAEGYLPDGGWAIEQKRTYENQTFQDSLDAEILYNIIEDEVVPVYYSRNESDVPEKWTQYMKHCMAKIAPYFTMQRMVDDYYTKFYDPLHDERNKLYAENYEQIEELVAWKDKIKTNWETLKVKSLTVPDARKGALDYGSPFFAELELYAPGINLDDIGVDIIFGNKNGSEHVKFLFNKIMTPVNGKNDILKFESNFQLDHSGVMDYAFRIYPKNDLLKYQMHFPLVKWA